VCSASVPDRRILSCRDIERDAWVARCKGNASLSAAIGRLVGRADGRAISDMDLNGMRNPWARSYAPTCAGHSLGKGWTGAQAAGRVCSVLLCLITEPGSGACASCVGVYRSMYVSSL
jgi:hypothetical protein